MKTSIYMTLALQSNKMKLKWTQRGIVPYFLRRLWWNCPNQCFQLGSSQASKSSKLRPNITKANSTAKGPPCSTESNNQKSRPPTTRASLLSAGRCICNKEKGQHKGKTFKQAQKVATYWIRRCTISTKWQTANANKTRREKKKLPKTLVSLELNTKVEGKNGQNILPHFCITMSLTPRNSRINLKRQWTKTLATQNHLPANGNWWGYEEHTIVSSLGPNTVTLSFFFLSCPWKRLLSNICVHFFLLFTRQTLSTDWIHSEVQSCQKNPKFPNISTFFMFISRLTCCEGSAQC